MRTTGKILGLLVAGWVLAACAPKPTVRSDPGSGGGTTDVNKELKDAQELALKRTVKKEEFSLTLIADSSVAQIDSIHVDAISTDANHAARLVADGPVKYRDSRITGATVKSHTFRKGGQVEIKVPSIAPADCVVLWAELAAPGKGSDTRMLELPLTLDRSDPTKGALANPITVKLTATGWQREN
ncbi:MAG: hypothetical protein NTW21_12240 [Verrucomicrobia bacterium]|nr:hypothetical protein [Verrucomicrobiota bacterium]